MTVEQIKSLKTIYECKQFTTFYHIHSYGTLQLTKTISKRVTQAFRTKEATDTLPKVFYFVEEAGKIKVFDTIIEIIRYYERKEHENENA